MKETTEPVDDGNMGVLGISNNRYHIELIEKTMNLREKVLIDIITVRFGIGRTKIEKLLKYFSITPKWTIEE